MQTVFSHIIQKRFSQVNEDVATDALSYVLKSSDAAKHGITKLLRGIIPDLPVLYFQTQQAEGDIRPDMWGFTDTEPRVFLENKFWAGLTENQPIIYLNKLASYTQPTVLLVVAPEAREETLWRELMRRLGNAGISANECEAPAGVAKLVVTQPGPILGLTSWTSVLSMLEHETVDDPKAKGDLVQLRALCDAADNEAFVPVSEVELSDQRTPAFILQLSSIVQATVDSAITENILSTVGVRPQASWERIGRYIWIPDQQKACGWFGIHFGLWKAHGTTPLWLIFANDAYGRAQEVYRLINPWATQNGILTTTSDQEVAIALDIPIREEKSVVIRSLVKNLREVAGGLGALPSKTLTTTGQQG